MNQRSESRSLGGREKEVARWIVNAAPIPDAAILINQLDSATVEPGDSRTFIDLAVPHSAPRSGADDGPLPGRTLVHDQAGQVLGEVMLWIRDGYLSALEFAWYTDDPPTEWPSPEQLVRG
jgi:hypothetical protein